MKNRYKYAITINNKEGKRAFATVLYPQIERTASDIYIRSTRGDRLDLYALKYYGDTRYWPLIASANQIGKGTLVVPPDMQIRIPPFNVDYDKKLLDINTVI